MLRFALLFALMLYSLSFSAVFYVSPQATTNSVSCTGGAGGSCSNPCSISDAENIAESNGEDDTIYLCSGSTNNFGIYYENTDNKALVIKAATGVSYPSLEYITAYTQSGSIRIEGIKVDNLSMIGKNKTTGLYGSAKLEIINAEVNKTLKVDFKGVSSTITIQNSKLKLSPIIGGQNAFEIIGNGVNTALLTIDNCQIEFRGVKVSNVGSITITQSNIVFNSPGDIQSSGDITITNTKLRSVENSFQIEITTILGKMTLSSNTFSYAKFLLKATGQINFNSNVAINIAEVGFFPTNNIDIRDNIFRSSSRLNVWIESPTPYTANITGNDFQSSYILLKIDTSAAWTVNFENNSLYGDIKQYLDFMHVGITEKSLSSVLNIKNNSFKSIRVCDEVLSVNIYNKSSSVLIQGNKFEKNSCVTNILFIDGPVKIYNNNFVSNDIITTKPGGILHILNDSTADIKNNKFAYNKVARDWTASCILVRAIYIDPNANIPEYFRPILIRNNIFFGNSKGYKGSCIYIRDFFEKNAKPVSSNGTPYARYGKYRIINNTFYNNESYDISIETTSVKPEFYIRNNIFSRTKYVDSFPTVLLVEARRYVFFGKVEVLFENNILCKRCITHGPYPGAPLQIKSWNNLEGVDPQFNSPSSEDFTLRSTSPAIDAGKNSPAYFLPAKDFEGDNRIIDGDGDGIDIVDIGADEYNPPPATATKQTLNVNLSNNFCGDVLSMPVGILCPGANCSAQFVKDTNVYLSVTVTNQQCQFSKWSGDCQHCGKQTSCSVVLDKDKTCTAEFVENVIILAFPPSVSINANPTSGTKPLKVSFTCQAIPPTGAEWITEFRWDFDSDGNVDRITPAPPLFFVGTTVTGTTDYIYQKAGNYTAKCTVVTNNGATASATANITVNDPTKYTVSVQKSGSGTVTSNTGGINCGSTCSEQVNSGNTLKLTATANSGYTFTRWDGDCSSCTTNICDLTITSDKLCIAIFEPTAPPANNPPNKATINANPTSGDAPLKVDFTCSATDPDGDQIIEYRWDTDNDGVVEDITQTGNLSILYTSKGTYEVKCAAKDSNGNIGNYSDPVSITVNTTYTPPPPPPDRYTLSVQIQGASSTDTNVLSDYSDLSGIWIYCPPRCSTDFYANLQVTLEVFEDVLAEDRFVSWGGDCASCGSNETCTITMDADKTCTATFRKNQYPIFNFLTANPNPVLVGQFIDLTCSATDPDGDQIYYLWDLDGDEWLDDITLDGKMRTYFTQVGTYTVTCVAIDEYLGYDGSKIQVTVVDNLEDSPPPTFRERRFGSGTYIKVEDGAFETVNELDNARCKVPEGTRLITKWFRFIAKVESGKEGVWVELTLPEAPPEGAKVGKCMPSGFKVIENAQISGNTVRFFIKDGGEFDYDGRKDGYVRDPFAVIVDGAQPETQPETQPGNGQPTPAQPNTPPTAQPTSGGGGGGCSTGGSVLLSLLILAVPFFRRLRG